MKGGLTGRTLNGMCLLSFVIGFLSHKLKQNVSIKLQNITNLNEINLTLKQGGVTFGAAVVLDQESLIAQVDIVVLAYDIMNTIQLPKQFFTPNKSVSILVSSYNTNASYVKDCLDSIKIQTGNIFFEVVWINDGSDSLHTTLLKKLLDDFKQNSRFTDVIYYENDGNKGIGHSLNKGIHLCNHEIIIKLDSDDIMVPNRIEKQFKYMEQNPDTAICGAQILMFKGTEKNHFVNITKHPTITWNDYIKDFPHWFVNHPTVCYRKSKVLEVGNYSFNLKETWGNDDLSHDFELELRMLKKYGKIYNFPEHLVLYRLHPNQVTHQGGAKTGGPGHLNKVRKDLIAKIVN